MLKIEFPAFSFKIEEKNGKELIFDPLRKAWIKLTPEEWVRQNFLQYLLQVKEYPSALVAVEKEIMLGEMPKRFDILVYDKMFLPWMMVECKSMEVPINEKVLQQLLRYNISVPVTYLVLTNGSYTYAYQRKNGEIKILEELPFFPEAI